jgi:hypothetical protein
MSSEIFINGWCFAEIQEEVSAKLLEFLESPCVTRDVVLTDKKVQLLELLCIKFSLVIDLFFFLAWGHLKQCDWLVMALKSSAVHLAVLHLLAELGTMN